MYIYRIIGWFQQILKILFLLSFVLLMEDRVPPSNNGRQGGTLKPFSGNRTVVWGRPCR